MTMRTGKEQARALIERLAPAPICDDCVATMLDGSANRAADQATSELVGMDGFERLLGRCSMCDAEKRVTRLRD